jgi:hypothetical protein
MIIASMFKVVVALNRNDRGKLIKMYSIAKYIDTDAAGPSVMGFHKRCMHAQLNDTEA